MFKGRKMCIRDSLWDRSVSVASFEGYRQLKLYFEKLWKLVNENGWLGKYMQCLVDEPQFPNSEHYRILSCIDVYKRQGIQQALQFFHSCDRSFLGFALLGRDTEKSKAFPGCRYAPSLNRYQTTGFICIVYAITPIVPAPLYLQALFPPFRIQTSCRACLLYTSRWV